MATGSFSYETGKYTFTINYSYTDTSFKITKVKTKCKQGGWAAWDLMPSLYLYILKGSSPVPYSYQTQYSGDKAKNHIHNHNGHYKNYHGNTPSAYLSNHAGGVVTWSNSSSNLSISLSGTSVKITIGSFIINTTNTISNVAYGYKTITLSLYSKPKDNFKPTIYNKTDTSITVKATWTNGSEKSKAVFKLGSVTKTITSSGNTVTFKNLKGNTKYNITAYLTDSKGTYYKQTITTTTKLSPVTSIKIVHKDAKAIDVQASSSNNTSINNFGYQYRYKLKSDTSFSKWSDILPSGYAYAITNLNQNNLYVIEARAARIITSTIGYNSKYYSIEAWTDPEVDLQLKLLEGSEHNTIVATASSISSNLYIKYIFKIDGNEFDINDYNKDIPNPMIFTNLKGNTTYTITVRSKNIVSQQEVEISKTITTWYDPIYSLSCSLVNKWYWFLSIKALFNYQGGAENIKKYEFGIFKDQIDNLLVDTGTANSYSKGSIIPGNDDKLEYNTNYNCMVKLTDNHGRTYIANSIFKTLDERPLYLNGNLSEVKMIKPDGEIEYITPNLLNAIQILDNGTENLINMNRIINNDNRTEFK